MCVKKSPHNGRHAASTTFGASGATFKTRQRGIAQRQGISYPLVLHQGHYEAFSDRSLQQWDHAISSLLIRSTLGLSFGVVFSVLLFKRRAWPAWVGLGFGAGRAWEEADGMQLILGS